MSNCSVSVAGDKVVRFAPPLVISRAQLDQAVAVLDESIAAACDLVAQAQAEEAVSPVSS